MKIHILSLVLFLFVVAEAYSQMQSDDSDAVWSIVMPIPDARDVEMTQCLVGTYKDLVVTDFVQNKGTWKFRVDKVYFAGADAKAFSLVSGLPVYTLETGKVKATEFRFRPTEARKYEAEIVIVTQAETLRRKITGEGIEPVLEIVNNIIDFGEKKVGENRDSAQALTIKNIGSMPLEIKSTKHNKPNVVDFSTTKGGGTFTLQPNAICKMDLRFTPSDKGRTSGALEFHYDGVGSPAVVQLYGTGIVVTPVIQAIIGSIDDIICESSSVKPIEIKNTGGEVLKIESIESSNTDFEIKDETKIDIAPETSKTINLIFNPATPGLKSADIIIKSNADSEPIKTISVSARKDSVALIPEFTVIDLGYLCPNEPKDTTLIINNTGTLKTDGKAELTGLITADNSLFTINPDKSHSLNIHYIGQDTEGPINEKITVYDSECGRSREVRIVGTVEVPSIKSSELNIDCVVNQTKNGQISITNTSNRIITINSNSISGMTAPFTIDGTTFPIIINPSANANIGILYSPVDNNPTTQIITIHAEECNIFTTTILNGIASTASATLQVNNFEAKAGEIIEVPILLNNQENLSKANISQMQVDLIFNPTLLSPLEYPVQPIDEYRAKITLDKLPTSRQIGEALLIIKFQAGLGNAKGCDLTLDKGVTIGGTAKINLISGRFTLLGVCEEGGTRLVNPNAEVKLQRVAPIPSSDKIAIDFSIIEKGQTEIVLINTLGEVVKSIPINTNSIGNKSEIISLDTVAQGQYLLMLRTPTQHLTTMIQVLK